jgi:signal transduction histidine kinase
LEKAATSIDDQLRPASAGRSIGWEWNVKSGEVHWFGDLPTVLGIPSEAYSADLQDYRRRIHPEDRKRVWEAISEARKKNKCYTAEFRVLREDNTVRCLRANGIFLYFHDGKAKRMLGTAVDITDAKVAEEALATVGSRLIEANEGERTWIARELHDDVNQQIAVLGIRLDRLKQHVSESTADVQTEVTELYQRITQLGKNVQALSHRLHSSKLDYLGIVAAGRSFCEELSAQYQLQIHFNHAGVPRKLPAEISLCLFRVLQEALQNAVKHSGAREFNVELCAQHGEIQLAVIDQGIGFDSQNASTNRGLGLISMHERLQLVKGQLSIRSKKGQGTTICARVPIHATEANRLRTA